MSTQLSPIGTAYLAFIQAAINAAADRQLCDQCGRPDRLQTFKKTDGRSNLELCRSCTRNAHEGAWLFKLAWPTVEMQGGK